MENADKQIAWFPASYLEEIDVHEDIQDTLSSDEEGKSACALGPKQQLWAQNHTAFLLQKMGPEKSPQAWGCACTQQMAEVQAHHPVLATAFSPEVKNVLPPLSPGSLYFVVRAYESQKADELSLHSGVVVEVVRKSDNGWWLIR